MGMTMPDPPDIRDYGLAHATRLGLHRGVIDRQFTQESGWRHWKSPGVVLTSYSGVAKGVGQLHKAYYPEEVWSDPYRNMDAALDTMFRNLARFGNYRLALAAFNWGPSNVSGYTKADGTVVPPWDGRRETISAQGAHYLDVILGPGWPEPTDTVDDGNGPPMADIRYEDYRDPAPAGRFDGVPKGVILHGSRSGVAGNPRDKEYAGTARYEQTNPNDLGWHATIGDGVVAAHLSPLEWGWHALRASKVYLGVEFAQPTVNDAITDSQVDAFVDWFKTRVQPAWPTLPLRFISHAEADKEQGVAQGKSDVHPLGSPEMDQLRARIMDRLEGAPVIVPDAPSYSVGPGILQAMKDRGDSPATDEMFTKRGEYDEWSEAYSASGRRYMYLPAVARVFVYEPAA